MTRGAYRGKDLETWTQQVHLLSLVSIWRPRALPIALWESPAFPNCLGQSPPQLISLDISLFTEPFPDRKPHNSPGTRTTAINIPIVQVNKLRLSNPVIHPKVAQWARRDPGTSGPLAQKPVLSPLLLLLLHYRGGMTTQNSCYSI